MIATHYVERDCRHRRQRYHAVVLPVPTPPLPPPETLSVSCPFAEPTVRGTLLRRYKRFFVDVDIDGVVHTAHTANTGAMTGLLLEGAPVLLTRHDTKTRKFPLELEAIDVGVGQQRASWVVVNTIRANRTAGAFLRAGVFPELGSDVTGTEVKVGDSRVDFTVGTQLVEVKSVTLRVGTAGRFPDARSERALKHAEMLLAHVDGGAALIFLCQRTDIESVGPADDVDPVYGAALRRAAQAGVRVLAATVAVAINDDGGGILSFGRRIPVDLS